MAETETYGQRFEKKIDIIQSEMRTLSDQVTRLIFINEAHQSVSEANRKDIDAISEKVRHLESQAAQLNGALNAFRYISLILSGALLGICGMIWGSLDSNTKDTITLKEKVTNIELSLKNRGS